MENLQNNKVLYTVSACIKEQLLAILDIKVTQSSRQAGIIQIRIYYKHEGNTVYKIINFVL